MILVVNGQNNDVALHNFDNYKRMDIISSNDGKACKVELTDVNNKSTIIVHSDQTQVMQPFIQRFYMALKADDTFFFATTVLQELLQEQAMVAAQKQEAFEIAQRNIKDEHLDALDEKNKATMPSFPFSEQEETEPDAQAERDLTPKTNLEGQGQGAKNV